MAVLQTKIDTQTDVSQLLPSVQLSSIAEVDRTKLMAAINLLPSNDQLLLALLYVEGLDLTETALVLDMTIADVLSQHAVSVIMLRGLLRPRCA